MIRFWGRKDSAKPPVEESAPVAEPAVAPEAMDAPEAVPVVERPAAEPAAGTAVAALPENPVSEAPPAETAARSGGWLSRLKAGLARSSNRLSEGIAGIFTKRRLDDATLDELEELLITADLGPATAARLVAELRRTRFGKDISAQEVRTLLAEQITAVLEPVARPLTLVPEYRPHVILVVGVNGTGKTTTIGKLARLWQAQGRRVMLAAGDTFRAAAVSQLQIWGERTGCPVVARETGADAAGLAYEALERAKQEGSEVLIIDTAGRLQNKTGLMDELKKVIRVLKKLDPDAPQTILLTLDATTGQNAHSQIAAFKAMVNINGLILTKLDGSARGGVLVALAESHALPVHAIGVGEGADDLRPFEAAAFARSLMGL
mgnify:CR=1 FL=1